MELRQLRQVIVLAETLNFSRAAERLHMTQPPLSTSIKKLEEELGVILFERLNSGLKLTAAGVAVVHHARRTLFCAEELVRAGREGASGEQGELRIGFVGSATYSLMPQIIRAFRRQYPRVDIVIDESTTVELLRRLETHAIDVALVRVPVVEPTTAELTMLRRERVMAAVSADSRFAHRRSVSLAELAEEPLITYSPSRVPGMYSFIMLAFAEAGVQPRIAQQAVQVQQFVGLVESGLGVAFIPASGGKYTGDGVRLLRIDPEPVAFRVGLALACLPDAMTPTARNFIALAKGTVSESPV